MNEDAAARADVVVAAVPAYHLTDTIDAVADELDGTALVAPAGGMNATTTASTTTRRGRERDGARRRRGPRRRAGRRRVPQPRGRPTGRPRRRPRLDTLLVADDEDAKETVRLLAEGIDGLRALDGGGLANAPEIEGITPLLINVARNNDGLHDLGIRFK